MLGRQQMMVDARTLRGLIAEFGLSPAPDLLAELMESCEGGYGEPLLRMFGAEEIVSIDASPYEGCTYSHDMNRPIPSALKGRFEVVIDGGTLEHIFNFPVAIQNCMDMLSVGGHFLSVTTGNNFAGHGFYQFSPELFYRVFSPQNGFLIETALVSEAFSDKTWYKVPDPQVVRSRVEFISARPTFLMIQARKVEQFDGMQSYPQQSDYTAIWLDQSPKPTAGERPVLTNRKSIRGRLATAVRFVPGAKRLVMLLRRQRARGRSLRELSGEPRGAFLEECEKGVRSA